MTKKLENLSTTVEIVENYGENDNEQSMSDDAPRFPSETYSGDAHDLGRELDLSELGGENYKRLFGPDGDRFIFAYDGKEYILDTNIRSDRKYVSFLASDPYPKIGMKKIDMFYEDQLAQGYEFIMGSNMTPEDLPGILLRKPQLFNKDRATQPWWLVKVSPEKLKRWVEECESEVLDAYTGDRTWDYRGTEIIGGFSFFLRERRLLTE